MTWSAIVRPRAQLQIAEAAEWYDSRTAGRGNDFLRAVEQAVATICNNPYQYQVLRGELRRVPLHKFPYLMIYAIVPNRK